MGDTDTESLIVQVERAAAGIARLPWAVQPVTIRTANGENHTGEQLVDANGFPVDLTDGRTLQAFLEWQDAVVALCEGGAQEAEELCHAREEAERGWSVAEELLAGERTKVREAQEAHAADVRANGARELRGELWRAWEAHEADHARLVELERLAKRGGKDREIARLREEVSRLSQKLAALEDAGPGERRAASGEPSPAWLRPGVPFEAWPLPPAGTPLSLVELRLVGLVDEGQRRLVATKALLVDAHEAIDRAQKQAAEQAERDGAAIRASEKQAQTAIAEMRAELAAAERPLPVPPDVSALLPFLANAEESLKMLRQRLQPSGGRLPRKAGGS